MTLPTTMKAMVLMGHGGLDQYRWHEDWPVPLPLGQEVLVCVGACGLNNTDVNTRTGWYSKAVNEATDGDGYTGVNADDPTWGGKPISFPRIQGADAVGRVAAVGPEADTSLLGKRVLVNGWQRDWSDPGNRDKVAYFGSEMDGGFAEYTVCDQRNLAVVNCDLSDPELATFSCSYTTAEGMLVRAGVTQSDTVLVPGASGGVGSALVQLAKRRGARVVAMASEIKHAEVTALGADHVLPRAPDNLQTAIGDTRISVVADVVGGSCWPQFIDVLERGGRYTCSGAIAGPVVPFDLRTFYLRDLSLLGSTIVPQNIFPDVVGYIERGEIRPLLAAAYPLRELRVAQDEFVRKAHVGNIVVVP